MHNLLYINAINVFNDCNNEKIKISACKIGKTMKLSFAVICDGSSFCTILNVRFVSPFNSAIWLLQLALQCLLIVSPSIELFTLIIENKNDSIWCDVQFCGFFYLFYLHFGWSTIEIYLYVHNANGVEFMRLFHSVNNFYAILQHFNDDLSIQH